MDCATPNQDIMSVASPLHSSSRRVTRHAAQTERCVVRSRDILLVSPAGGLDDVALTGVGLVRELPEEPGVAVLVHVPPLEGRHALQRLPFGRLGDAAHRGGAHSAEHAAPAPSPPFAPTRLKTRGCRGAGRGRLALHANDLRLHKRHHPVCENGRRSGSAAHCSTAAPAPAETSETTRSECVC